MDDKTGLCNEGKFPVFNILKRELTKTVPTTRPPMVSGFPRGFWSKRYKSSAAVQLHSYLLNKNLYFCVCLYYFVMR
jgi:hypothetical protein